MIGSFLILTLIRTIPSKSVNAKKECTYGWERKEEQSNLDKPDV
jgi:hypothetical protein